MARYARLPLSLFCLTRYILLSASCDLLGNSRACIRNKSKFPLSVYGISFIQKQIIVYKEFSWGQMCPYLKYIIYQLKIKYPKAYIVGLYLYIEYHNPYIEDQISLHLQLTLKYLQAHCSSKCLLCLEVPELKDGLCVCNAYFPV